MSKLVTWSFPTRIVFGAGAIRTIGEEARRLDAVRALVVTDKGVVKAGLHEPVLAGLKAAGVEAEVFDGVLPNPIEKNVHEGVAAFRAARAELVVALGGGSPLDIGKLIVVGADAAAMHTGATLEGSWDGESVLVADQDAGGMAVHLPRRERRAPLLPWPAVARSERPDAGDRPFDAADHGAGRGVRENWLFRQRRLHQRPRD